MDHLIDDNDRLEPCPFCGAEAEIIKIDGEIDAIDTGGLCVQCTDCGASSALIYPLMDDVMHLLMERRNKRRTASKPDTDLDLDDVAATSPKAKAELGVLRAENARLHADKEKTMEWQPIETAPWEREVLLTGESGYCKPHDRFVINGYRVRDWHQGEWNDATGTHLSERGWGRPTHWTEMPAAPNAHVDC